MKSYIKKPLLILSIGSMLAVGSSCSSTFLDEEVYSSLAPSTLANKLGFEAALIGLYNIESTFYTQSDQQGWLCVWQVGTDITWPTQPQGIEVPFYRYNTLTADNNAVKSIWTLEYKIINNANSIIYNIENGAISDMTDAEKKVVNAEARFFRAKAYNMLATLFGAVPLITQPVTTPRFDYVRTPLADVNAQIETDLTYAVQNLPVPYTTTAKQARVNKYAASHLFAEYYLRTNQNDKAEAQCDIVINSGAYQLITARYGIKKANAGDAFSDMFFQGNLRRTQGNTEGIWVLENENPTDVRNGSTGSPQQRRVWGGAYHNRNGMLPADSLGGRGISRMRLNNWVLYKLYDAGDMRNSRFSIHRQHYYNDPSKPATYGQIVPYTGADTLYIINPYTLKWGQYDSRDAFGFGMWKDFMIMRLGETYLFRAEARMKQGKTQEAADDINVLRTRANAPQVTAGDMDIDFILDERVRELLAEENRRLTLMRTGKLVDRASTYNLDAPSTMLTVGIEAKHALFPIPLTEIQLNREAVLEQNNGY